jgi:hypothetical protein
MFASQHSKAGPHADRVTLKLIINHQLFNNHRVRGF